MLLKAMSCVHSIQVKKKKSIKNVNNLKQLFYL